MAMKGDVEFSHGERSEQVEAVAELVTQQDYPTKTRINNVLAQSVFEFIGFDLLSPAEQSKIISEAYKLAGLVRDPKLPVTSGDYFFMLSYYLKINAISEKGGSRDEYVKAWTGIQQAAQNALNSVARGFGIGGGST